MSFTSLVAGAALGMSIAVLGLVLQLQRDDMKVCQLSHSYSVCFQALNR